jgi:hypothetical protein
MLRAKEEKRTVDIFVPFKTDGILKSKDLPTSFAADEVEGMRSLAA